MSDHLRTIPGFPDYQIDRDGNVYNRHSGKKLETYNTKTGESEYQRVSLRKAEGDEFTDQYVHRLLASAFGGSPEQGKTQVDHKDRDPTNNKASNLRWTTPSENSSNRSTSRKKLISKVRRKKEDDSE